jgi:hypothetical protein
MNQTTEYARVAGVIRTIRGCQVILESDMAALYGIEVRRLSEQVNRPIAARERECYTVTQ